MNKVFIDSLLKRAPISARELGIGAVAGVVLALLGPMGTFTASLVTRIGFWVPLLVLGAIGGGIIARATSRRLGRGDNHARRVALLTLAIGIPMGALAWVMARLVFTQEMPHDPLFFLWSSLLITAPMTAIMEYANTPGPETKAAPLQAPRFRERLEPPHRGAEIFAVSSEDHYLRVHNSAGGTLILMRLSDAIGELDGIEGAQVHRSWWVARAAIERVEKSGRNWSLALKGGVVAPVSRANIAVLRDAGWFDEPSSGG